MLKNYFKTGLRNLMREKGSTLINISGLTLGITMGYKSLRAAIVNPAKSLKSE